MKNKTKTKTYIFKKLSLINAYNIKIFPKLKNISKFLTRYCGSFLPKIFKLY
jgi:hypothetical protein